MEVKGLYKTLDFVPHMEHRKPSPFLLIYTLLDNRDLVVVISLPWLMDKDRWGYSEASQHLNTGVWHPAAVRALYWLF